MDAERARKLLLAEKERLEAALQSPEMASVADSPLTDSTSELADVDQHPADMGTETFEREKNYSIRIRLQGELADVERALKRLEQGNTYGLCEICGKPIPDDRLEALPGTRYCVEHAREVERQRAR
jgi:RNA polymerase-binding transcription factor DksA